MELLNFECEVRQQNRISRNLCTSKLPPSKTFENFVVTIELHLTHPDYGAVKLEDVVLVKENGCRILTITPGELFFI